MDNALKFTPVHGEVVVRIEPTESEVHVVIKDSGPGIPVSHQSLIFDRFRQAQSGNTKEGAGLGLAIVKKIMDLHNARIQVFSTPEEGTSFSFSLPVYSTT